MGLPLWGEGRRGKGMAEEASVLINHIVLLKEMHDSYISVHCNLYIINMQLMFKIKSNYPMH